MEILEVDGTRKNESEWHVLTRPNRKSKSSWQWIHKDIAHTLIKEQSIPPLYAVEWIGAKHWLPFHDEASYYVKWVGFKQVTSIPASQVYGWGTTFGPWMDRMKVIEEKGEAGMMV